MFFCDPAVSSEHRLHFILVLFACGGVFFYFHHPHFLFLHFLLLETFCEIGDDLVVLFKAVPGSSRLSQKYDDLALLSAGALRNQRAAF